MAVAYVEILREDEAALRIHPNVKGWHREVAVFGSGLDQKGAEQLRERVYDAHCVWCSNNENSVPDGKCTGAYIEDVDGKKAVIARTRGRRFTRKSRLATCNDAPVY